MVGGVVESLAKRRGAVDVHLDLALARYYKFCAGAIVTDVVSHSPHYSRGKVEENCLQIQLRASPGMLKQSVSSLDVNLW